MTENSKQEMEDNPKEVSGEIPPIESTIPPDEAPITPTQETANMEVHHHPDLHHKPKKWKEYLLEFLMIFLAVTLGFFAENLREHQVEKKVETALVHSLLDDLKADTAAFNDNASFWSNRLSGIDSLRNYLRTGVNTRNTERMYYWVEQMFEFTDFKYHDATIQQLQNTGNFRLIEKKRVVDSLIAYNASIKSYYFNVETTARAQYLFLRHMQTQLFNSSNFKRFASAPIDSFPRSAGETLPVERKPGSIFEYYNELYNYKFLAKIQVENDQTFRNQAIRLIELIQKEYDSE